MKIPAASPVAELKSLVGSGEYLAAADLARRHLREHPGDDDARYWGILALARSGATQTAMAVYRDSALMASEDVDHRALGPRLLKDHALSLSGSGRRAALAQAARAYHRIFDETGAYYPAINAATLFALAGESDVAARLARRCVTLVEAQGAGEGLAEYFRLATLAEARILLGDAGAARDSLARAAPFAGRDYSAMASTRRQLELLLDGDAAAVLAPLDAPAVIHFCGHMVAEAGRTDRRLKPGDVDAVAAGIGRALAGGVAAGYGSLASGADILFAEALLARGAALHVVLPFAMEEFVDVSVRAAGDRWVRRFRRCLEAAASVSHACEGGYLGDDVLFHYASRMAMGLAIQKARDIRAPVRQVAVWDGAAATGAAGTAADVAFWAGLGLPSTLLSTDGEDRGRWPIPAPPSAQHGPEGGRQAHAMLFADFKGFSKLRDDQVPAFVDRVLGTVSRVLEDHRGTVLARNTWGDGLFVVLTDAGSAARCALGLQHAVSTLDLAGSGLPATLSLRLGAHFGPVYRLHDPVLVRDNFFGAHVSRAARIEPVTPAGEVYATRQMVAELALLDDAPFTAEYVGVLPAAKDYGEFPMYLLRRREGSVDGLSAV